MADEFKLEGMEELIVRLQTVEDRAANLMTKNALYAGALIFKGSVVSKIRRSKANKDHAADHIEISKIKKKDGIPYMQIGISKGNNSKFFYLKFFEWGTVKQVAEAPFGRTLAEEKHNIKAAMAKALKEGFKL